MAHPNMREADLMRQIQDWLRLNNHCFIRVNVGARVEFRPHGGKRFMRFGRQGCADILACIDGRFVAIECKTERGRQSEHQQRFQQEVEYCRGIYVLARSLDDVIAAVPTRQKRLVMA